MRKLVLAAYAVVIVVLNSASGARAAETVSREQDIVAIRLGQRIQVDDGSCPQGQIKEVSGAQLNSAGVMRVARCVPRQGARR